MASSRDHWDLPALLSALLLVPEQLKGLEQQLKILNERTATLEFKSRAVYDIKALREMGIPRHQAYELARQFGTKSGGNGRYLITHSALERALATGQYEAASLAPLPSAKDA